MTSENLTTSSGRYVLTTDILEAIKGHETSVLSALGIQLNRRGHQTCPYPGHVDRHPSWRWDERKACAYCSCSKSDSIFDVVMKIEGIDFDEAKLRCAELAGLHKLIRGGDGDRGRRQRRSSPSPARPAAAPVRPPQPPQPARDGLPELLKGYQAALPGSYGEKYLRRRRIPIELAQRYGVGYAASGTWPGRDANWGRVVFAHTDPDGNIINLYGRAVGSDEKVPKGMRHDHLRGAKAYFNAQALRGSGPLFIVEGVFDALALIAAGHVRTVAIFGVNGWRWEWAHDIEDIVLAFDANALDPTKPAHDGWQELVRGALMRGKKVRYLSAEAFGGAGDISAAWAAGVLNVELQPEAFDRATEVAQPISTPDPQLADDPLDPLQHWP